MRILVDYGGVVLFYLNVFLSIIYYHSIVYIWNYFYFHMSSFDHEADSTSNLEFSRAFRCSRRFCLRSAPQSLLHPTFSVLKT